MPQYAYTEGGNDGKTHSWMYKQIITLTPNPTCTNEVLRFVTNVKLLNDSYSEINYLYGISNLIRLVSFMTCFVTKVTSIDRITLLHSKLAQLVIQVQYHVNIIYSLRGGCAHTFGVKRR